MAAGGRVDSKVRTLLQALPTKSDIEILIGRLEKKHSEEMQEFKKDVQSLTAKLTAGGLLWRP